ncbi:hypothetical protein [Streptomyces sp. NPDC004267]|uniref:hypothetical protein n=1 Tax=Streptomyces sp. NPDC004267 TaxID=3364694 RepID=UPI0036B1C747
MTNGRFEDELGAVLRATGEGFAVDDRRELAAGGLARGRRRLVRRRVATVGGALALAAIGVGGVYGGSLLGGSAGSGGIEQTSVAGPAPAGDGGEGAGQKGGAGPGTPSIPVAELAAVLKANTPAGTWQIDNEQGTGQSVTGVYDDGKGTSGVSVGLYRAGSDGESGTSQVTCPDQVAVPYDACTTERLAGGAKLMVFQGYEYPDKRVLTKNWRAVLLTKDGFLVDASEYNAPTEKDSAITRPNPPFDPAQLKKLVTADGWRPLLAQLPALRKAERAGAPSAPDARISGPTGAQVRSTLTALLPKGLGLRVVAKGGEGEHGYVVVDDGHGRSLVQVNVQPDMGGVRKELFGGPGVTTEPDGTMVKLEKKAGEKGGAGVVWWSADTMDKNGFRVIVSAFNSGTQHDAATRTDPALTTEQLKEIALSSKWHQLVK